MTQKCFKMFFGLSRVDCYSIIKMYRGIYKIIGKDKGDIYGKKGDCDRIAAAV